MRAHEVMDINAKTRNSRKKEPEIEGVRIRKAENGGHIVTHEFKSGPEHEWREPEPHVFGEDEGAKLINHIMKHAGIKAPNMDLDEKKGDHEPKVSEHEKETEEGEGGGEE